MGNQGRVVVIGVGSEFRRDDGAGPDVIARLRGQVPAGVELRISDGIRPACSRLGSTPRWPSWWTPCWPSPHSQGGCTG